MVILAAPTVSTLVKKHCPAQHLLGFECEAEDSELGNLLGRPANQVARLGVKMFFN